MTTDLQLMCLTILTHLCHKGYDCNIYVIRANDRCNLKSNEDKIRG